MNVKVGIRIVRGPDWSWEDQDGGEGNVGTVVEVKELTSDGEDNVLCGTTVIVCWDIGVLSNYRCGFGGKYDVRLYDNAQTGVSHPTVTCDGCGTSPVYGMRWKCATCYDYDLCTECYMSNKHSLEHCFLRYDTPRSEGVPVPARSGGRRVKAKGFFKGAVVSRGIDWNWDDQDGGIDNTGIVKDIRGWRHESYRSIAEVEWGTSGSRNIYRVGHKGKVDLKCDTPGDGGEYYPDHLPMSATASSSSVIDEPVTLVSGDKVEVSVDSEQFREQQEDHGGWNGSMNQDADGRSVAQRPPQGSSPSVHLPSIDEQLSPPPPVDSIATTGVVVTTTSQLDTSPIGTTNATPVVSDSTSTTSSITSPTSTTSSITSSTSTTSITSSTNTTSAITSSISTTSPITSSVSTTSITSPTSTTSTITPGASTSATIGVPLPTTTSTMVPNISSNLPKVTSSTGKDMSIHQQLGFHLFQDGDIVRVIDDLALVHQLQEGHGEWNDDIALALGQLGRVLTVYDSGDCRIRVNGYDWTLNPQSLVPAPGETPPDMPVMKGEVKIVHVLREELKLISAFDDPQALIAASNQGEVEILRDFLVRNPSTVNTLVHGVTALHVAAGSGKEEIVNLLLQYKADVNLVDEDERCTALHLACRSQCDKIVEVLLEAGADPSIADGTSFNPLHTCCKRGYLTGCEHILKKFPHLLNVRKPDGFGPLHLASLNGHFECAKYIIEQERCDIDAITFEGETALHKAIINGHVGVAELLVGHGIDLDVLNENRHSALHLAVTLSRHSNDRDASFWSVHSTEIKNICSTFSDLSGSVGLAGLACLLVREGADLYCMAELGSSRATPLQLCSDDLALHLTRYAGERSTFHGSLRKSPKPTPADLVEEEDTPKPQKTAEESSRPTDEHESVEQQKTNTHQSTVSSDNGTSFNSTSTVEDKAMLEHPRTEMGPSNNPEMKPTKRSIPVTKPTNTPIPQTTPPSQQPPDDEEACLLCDRPIDVRIEPCGHTVLCRSHANTAKRCPQCRGPIHSIADLEPLCGMCQESVCSVTLKPCDHMMCSACALLMKRCFECKTKITSKIGLDEAKAPAVKSKNDPTSITTTDSNVSISDESLLCEICVSNKKNTAFTCGHQLCYDCSLKVDKCPICREEIKFRIKLH